MKTVLAIGLFIVALQCVAQKADFEDINFQRADAIALECKHEGLDNMPLLVHHLTSQLTTDVEKFRAIYRWVAGNIANDYQLYERNMRKRQRFKDNPVKLKTWNETFRTLSFKKMRNEHSAICTGYAYLVKELSRMANIRCEVVNGYAKTSTIDVETLMMPNHSWNVVELNGTWYLCDATWASGIPNAETLQFEFDYNDGFFLANPELFAINHYPEDKKWLLIAKNAPSFEDFLEAPIIYGQAYAKLNTYSAPKRMYNSVKRNETVTFKCELLKSVNTEDISLLIDSGNSSKKVHPEATTIIDNNLTITYVFEHSGFYDVHLFIGDDLISTCTFKVKG